MLTKRLIQLKAYLDMVVSTEEAPSEPLKDLANDELTQVTNELSHVIVGLADVANTSLSLSNTTEQVSETTSSVMETLVNGVNSSNTSQKTIEAVASEVDDIAKAHELLQEESPGIGSVLDVIRGIADQTNLLALNAAIEAARAGIRDEVLLLSQTKCVH